MELLNENSINTACTTWMLSHTTHCSCDHCTDTCYSGVKICPLWCTCGKASFST